MNNLLRNSVALLLFITCTATVLKAQTGNIGIGTNTPVEKLEVNGAIKLGNTTTENLGTIRYTDEDHLEIYTLRGWVILDEPPPPPAAWELQGNYGTVPGFDYIGTNDYAPLIFKTNNTEALRITSSGNIL